MPTLLPAASSWLAEADPDPERASRWLCAARIVLLPLGRTFDAVKTPFDIGRLVCNAGIDGPGIVDPAGQSHFFLVPPGTVWACGFVGDEAICLGTGTYLTVPVPEATAPPGPYWCQPPTGHEQLSDPVRLAELLRTVGEAS